ncbi:MAG: 16S rRNA (cytidine(1402)-2'-O)-methyltransferase [Gammaproteobacteria bacterium]|nr:MAG: 16S rRNA (cytidine(1402)-2'-O)-methyltransferase [Gammaproteobacteria bacterium]
MPASPGLLYIVATPIGNLGDMSPRAVETLKSVDLIAAEDTRHSLPLLKQFGVATPLTALHEHNEREAVPTLIARLQQGASIALISDAGTPLLSDPGYHLTRAAHEAGIRVTPIPGASALSAALSASGLRAGQFVFEGFLPPRAAARRARLEALRGETRTLALFEAPHRLLETLEDLAALLGAQRRALLARELTKTFETLRLDTLRGLHEFVRGDPQQQKGESVILVEGAEPSAPLATEAEKVLRALLAELPLKQAVKLASAITGVKKNDLYDLALKLQLK